MSALTRRSLALGLVIGSLVVVAAAAPHRGAPSVSSLVVGQYNACAVVGGTVKCWGANDRQFENSGREALATPITVSDLPRRPGAIALGNQSLCVLTAAGGVQCRGKNDFGQLGNGVASSSAKFVNALGLKSGVRMVAIGTFTTCALRTDRTLKCWGANTNGRSGTEPRTSNRTLIRRPSAVSVDERTASPRANPTRARS